MFIVSVPWNYTEIAMHSSFMQYPNLGFGLSTETGQAGELASLRPWSTVLIQAVLLASFTRFGEGDDGPLDLLALVLDRVGVREVGALGASVDHEVPRRVLRVVQDVEAAVVPVVLPHDVDVGKEELEAVLRLLDQEVVDLGGQLSGVAVVQAGRRVEVKELHRL